MEESSTPPLTLQSILPQILLPLSLLLSLALPPFKLRGPLCSTLILSLVYLTWTSPFPPPTSSTQPRYALFAAWFFYVPTLHKLLCTVPEESFWRIRRDEKGKVVSEKEAMSMRACGWEKIKWALALLANPRGVGWNFEIKGLRRARFARNERAAFLRRQGLMLAMDYLLVEAGMAFVKSYSLAEVLERLGWGERVLVGVACGLVIKGSWEAQWLFVSIVSVAVGISTPEEWPDFFGDITECSTLSYFWGTYWQQVLKHSLLGFSRTLISILHIPAPTLYSYTTHLLTGFLISAVFHGASLYYLLPTPPHHLFLSNTLFFLAQVPAILLETYALSVFSFLEEFEEDAEGKLHKRSSAWRIGARIAGYVWVFAWLFVTGWPFLEAYFNVGMAEWDVPFSVLKRLCAEGNEGVCVIEGLDWEIWGRL